MFMAQDLKLPTINVVDLVCEKTSKRYEPVLRMVVAIVKVIKTKGECSQQDLAGRDFTSEEISELWHLAKALAEVELRLIYGDKAHSKIRNIY